MYYLGIKISSSSRLYLLSLEVRGYTDKVEPAPISTRNEMTQSKMRVRPSVRLGELWNYIGLRGAT